MRILVIHGPNLNLLGQRETEIYGDTTLADINQMIKTKADELGVEVGFFQSSSEGALIDRMHQENTDAIIINPAAYTHYSIALRDAITAVRRPAVEVHLSNIFAREPFRRKSVVSPAVKGVITGLGARGYLYALDYLVGSVLENT